MKSKPRAGRQRGARDSFTGRAGQLAVMAELLHRECNAAIPEVDRGTDVFAFRDDREEVARIQVKTNSAPTVYKNQSGYSAKFAIPLKQLKLAGDQPALYYALAVRLNGVWVDFLVISRAALRRFLEGAQPFGSENHASGDLEITVEFREQVECSGRNLTAFRNAWETLPPLRPLREVTDESSGASEAGMPGAIDAPPP